VTAPGPTSFHAVEESLVVSGGERSWSNRRHCESGLPYIGSLYPSEKKQGMVVAEATQRARSVSKVRTSTDGRRPQRGAMSGDISL
jgi:hypothetical protein